MAEKTEDDTQATLSEEIVVDWDGPNDPENPKNWSYKKKWSATIVISLFTLISPVSSSMVAPAAESVAADLGITNTVELEMTISVFVLAYAVGPLFLGPLSEIFGRARVIQLANLFYFVWNLVCGFAQTKVQLIVFRFLAGIGGSAPLAVGGGVLADIWPAEQRGKAIAIYSLTPLLGPALGPLCGAWTAERSTWRWVFWSTSIVTILVQLNGLFFLRESFPPVLLERKAARLYKAMAADDLEKNTDTKRLRTVYDSDDRSWKAIFSKALSRPAAIFYREPIVQVIALYMAFMYGVFYLFLTQIPSIFSNVYHETTGIAGLHYIALGIGVTGVSQINAFLMDRIYSYMKKRNNGVGVPEFRVPSMVPGTLLLPGALLLTGWSAQKQLHFIATDVGIALVGGCMILCFQSMQTYLIDCFTLYAASALAAVNCLRSIAGFGFPLFAPRLYETLGYGRGNTILAGIAIGLGWPAPAIFWYYGAKIRDKSRYAKQLHLPASSS